MPQTHSILRAGLRKYFGCWAGASATMPIVLGAISFAPVGAALAAPCTGPGAPTTTQTECLTAVLIPGNPLQSFDISWVDADRAEYYLGDRANAGIDIIDTEHNTFKRTIGGFVGIKFNADHTAIDNNHSGPDGVVTHGRWLYAGDGDSTLKVIDLNAPTASAIKQTLSTGGTTRVDEMALTTDGKLLLVANNAEDPPFGTLFAANGDASVSNVSKILKINVDSTIIPPTFGLSIEQPAWEPKTARFYTAIPVIASNPPGCNFDGNKPPITCDGGLLVTDPHNPAAVQGAFDPTTNTGVVPLHACGPNGATVGPHENLLLGCTPGNNPSNTTTLVINAETKNYANIGGITGSDEVWFNPGDKRYYTGSSAMTLPAGSPLGRGSVLGVIDGTSVLIESIPQSSGSHSVAADCKRNKIFVPQVATNVTIGFDANTTAGPASPTVGSLICGSQGGCVAVYIHEVDDEDSENNRCQNEDHENDHNKKDH
jgi:hypothetical protein